MSEISELAAMLKDVYDMPGMGDSDVVRLCDLAEAQERDAPRWIPVAERLPEAFVTVLLATSDGVRAGYLIDRERDDTSARWCAFPLEFFPNVTAWQPLPAAPEVKP